MDAASDGFDGSFLKDLPLRSPAELGQAAVAQAVALVTAAQQWPEAFESLTDEIALHAPEHLRVAIGAALLMLGYEVSVSFDPPEVRLQAALDEAAQQLAQQVGPAAASELLHPARIAAIAYCNQVDEVYAELLQGALADRAQPAARFGVLLALAALASAWIGPETPRRRSLLSQVALAAAGRPDAAR